MAFLAAAAPFLPAIATVAGTAFAVIGAINNANANAEAQRYQAMVAERNQQIQLANAERAGQRAQMEAQQQDQTTRALVGQLVAEQSASGLRIGGRSQMLTRKTARELGRLDTLNIRQAGDIEVHNYRVAAEDAGNEATFSRQSANNSILSGWIDAGSALFSGIGSLKVPGAGGNSLIGKTKVPAVRKLGSVRAW